MKLGLEGKVALVTGGGQGVGRRICLELAAEGVKVAVNDLVESRATAVAKEIGVSGGTAFPYVADITRWDQVDAMVKAIGAEIGSVDILVNNAGVTPERRAKGGVPPSFLEMPQEDWRKVIDLNVYGMMHCCRAVLPDMVRRKHGKIISIMSEAGRIGEARLAVYSGAKAAILGFSKALAREHGADSINVNVVALGATAHEGITSGALRLDATPETESRLGKMFGVYPIGKGLGRLGRPEDVSGMVAFLASERAAFITGQSVGVSGGYAMI
jgi:3-oxoacyl-[acyl-carrier protein] reductase